MRHNSRTAEMMRSLEIIPNVNLYAEGSCIIKAGNTKVLCTASIDREVPAWLQGQNKGWLTAEYALLPRSTQTRVLRETKGVAGRTQEIQRLIGRSLRAVVDLEALNGFNVHIDCDVLQADGGTRTASISGGFVALWLAMQKLVKEGELPRNPVREFVAAIQEDVELLCSIADPGRKSQIAAFAKPSLGPGICLPILHANTSAYRANHMFHGTFLQTIRFKEDITRIHIEISMVFEDFIHTFCPAYIFSEKRYNRCTH